MPRIDIARLDITGALDKLWRHGITAPQAHSVLSSPWIVTRNRSNRAASYLLIGRDEQGRCLTMPIVQTDDPLLWRVITGWYCKSSEAAILRQRRSIMEEPVQYGFPQVAFDEEEAELMDPDNWDWDNPIEGNTVGDPKAVLRIQFGFEEVDALFQAAHAQGATVEDFVRQLALEGLHARSHGGLAMRNRGARSK
jgi:hypothetical protein